MSVRWEWQRTRSGKRYRRIVERDTPAKGGKVAVSPDAVAEAEAVPEVKIEAEGQVTSPKRGRPKTKNVDAPADE